MPTKSKPTRGSDSPRVAPTDKTLGGRPASGAGYTPGPWSVQELEMARHGYEGWRTFAIRSPENVCLAVVGEVDRYDSQRNEANTRLMAAAPIMRDVLARIAKWADTMTPEAFAMHRAAFVREAEAALREVR